MFALSNVKSKELQDYAQSVMNPASPNYRKFLTIQQIGERYGAPITEVNKVVAFVNANGMKVTNVWPNRMFVSATSSVANAEKTFAVKIQGYDRPMALSAKGVPATMYSADRKPALPSNVASSVNAVFGLSNAYVARHEQVFSDPTPVVPPPLPGPISNFNNGHLSPADISKYYNVDAIHNDGIWGEGRYIAIISPTGVNMDDINYFADFWGRSKNVYQLSVDGGNTDLTNQVEACLDAEVILGQADDAAVYLLQSPNTGASFLNLYNTVAYYSNAFCVSSASWTFDENTLRVNSMPFLQAFETTLSQLTALGVANYNSSGDWGRTNDHTNIGIGYPVGSPNVTAVGGTDNLVESTGSYVSEEGWSGSGGGYSSVFYRPIWQNTPGVNASINRRQVPDISACGGGNPGYWVRAGGAWMSVWGTSASCPLWAAVHALYDIQNGERLGSLNASLYKLDRTVGWCFNDITVGNNGYPCTGGYDLVTGIGSANFGKLSADLFQQPDLTPYKPSLAGWKAPLFIYKAGTTVEPTYFHSTIPYLFGAAVVNWGPEADAPNFLFDVTTNGTRIGPVYQFGSLPPYTYRYATGLINTTLPVGRNTLALTVDRPNKISENNETNQVYKRIITVLPGFTAISNNGPVKGGNSCIVTCTFSSALPNPSKLTLKSNIATIIPAQTYTITTLPTTVNLSVPTNVVTLARTVNVTVTYGSMKLTTAVSVTK